MKLLLPKGQIVLVDDNDSALLNGYTWYLSKRGYVIGNPPMVNGLRTKVRLHRLLMAAKPGEIVDHINMDKLDNRRSNLRIVSPLVNTLNRPMMRNNKSGYRGVSWSRLKNKWIASIKINRTSRTIGFFNIKEDAARSYNKKAIELFGTEAHLNKIEDIL